MTDNVRPFPKGTRRRGRPRRVPDMTIAGTTGLRISGGYVHEEVSRELIGIEGYRVYREMRDTDPVVGAVLMAVEMMLRRVKVHAEPAEGDTSAEGKEAAEFVQSCVEDMDISWQDTMAEILTMLPYGWSLMETVCKVRGGDNPDQRYNSRFTDGKIGWRKWALRGQDTLMRWEWDADAGFVKGMHQMDGWSGRQAFIPITKALLFRTTTIKQNPEGRSVLRNAYSAWYFKKHIQTIEAIGIERDLAGLPAAGVPPEYLDPNASPANRAVLGQIMDMLTGVRNDEQAAIIYPLAYDQAGKPLFEFKLVSTGGQRQFNTDEIVNRYNRDIALTVLADFLLLGHEKQGSFALSEDKSSMFSVAISAWLDAVFEIINRYAIVRLLRLNGMKVDKPPRLVHGDVEDVSLDVLGTFLQKLALAGVPFLSDEKTVGNVVQQLMARAKLPAPNPKDVEPVEATPPGMQGLGKGGINPSGQVGKGGAKQRGQGRAAPDQKGTSGGSHTPPKSDKAAATEEGEP